MSYLRRVLMKSFANGSQLRIRFNKRLLKKFIVLLWCSSATSTCLN